MEFRSVFDSDIADWVFRDFSYCIRDNWWNDYFQQRYKGHLIQGENWIDIEQEIKGVIKFLENDAFNIVEQADNDEEEKADNKANSSKAPQTLAIIMKEVFKGGEHKLRYIISKKKYDKFRNDLKKEFDKFVMALGIYLDVFVRVYDTGNTFERIVGKMADDVKQFNHVLCFNYLNNYYRQYVDSDATKDNQIDEHNCFVHGSIRYRYELAKRKRNNGLPDYNSEFIETLIENNNMVIGFDEYKSEEGEEAQLDFVYYRKYYQRMLKGTERQYLGWLDEYLGRDKQEDNNDSEDKKNHIFIFGHSMDATDKDIFRDLLLRESRDSKITIFYHDEAAHHRIIENLIRIMSREVLYKKVYAKNPEIEILPQTVRLQDIL